MIGWTKVIGFEWDDGNSRKSAEKHGVSRSEAEQIFFNHSLLVVQDAKHSNIEPRFHALGSTETGRRLHVSFTLLSKASLVRVISARDMLRK